MKYWAIYVLSSGFTTWPKSQDKNLNILRTKRAFNMKQKAFFYHYWRAIIEANEKIFLGRWGSDFKLPLILPTGHFSFSYWFANNPYLKSKMPWTRLAFFNIRYHYCYFCARNFIVKQINLTKIFPCFSRKKAYR